MPSSILMDYVYGDYAVVDTGKRGERLVSAKVRYLDLGDTPSEYGEYHVIGMHKSFYEAVFAAKAYSILKSTENSNLFESTFVDKDSDNWIWHAIDETDKG